MLEDIAGIVAELRETQAVFVNETLERGFIARPRDSNEINLAAPLLCCRFDRRGFPVANTSSGCPKPEGGRCPRYCTAVERAATDQRGAEVQGCGYRLGSVGRSD
jgi:hypothetical protein